MIYALFLALALVASPFVYAADSTIKYNLVQKSGTTTNPTDPFGVVPDFTPFDHTLGTLTGIEIGLQFQYDVLLNQQMGASSNNGQRTGLYKYYVTVKPNSLPSSYNGGQLWADPVFSTTNNKLQFPKTLANVTPRTNVEAVSISGEQLSVRTKASSTSTFGESQTSTLSDMIFTISSTDANNADYWSADSAYFTDTSGQTTIPLDLPRGNDVQPPSAGITNGITYSFTLTLLGASPLSPDAGASYIQYSYTPGCPACGDPVFNGFNGQKFQVHGTPNHIYNLISMPCLSVNSLFEFIGKKAGEAVSSRTVSEMEGITMQSYVDYVESGEQLSSLKTQFMDSSFRRAYNQFTAKWTHSGTYMGTVSVLVNDHKVLIRGGDWSEGFNHISVDGKPLEVLDHAILSDNNGDIPAYANAVVRLSSHQAVVWMPYIRLVISNSHRFLNIESADLYHNGFQGTHSNYTNYHISHMDGLLGQTHEKHGMSGNGKKEMDAIAGTWADARKRLIAELDKAGDTKARNDLVYHVDDYEVKSNYIFGTDFNENRYTLERCNVW